MKIPLSYIPKISSWIKVLSSTKINVFCSYQSNFYHLHSNQPYKNTCKIFLWHSVLISRQLWVLLVLQSFISKTKITKLDVRNNFIVFPGLWYLGIFLCFTFFLIMKFSGPWHASKEFIMSTENNWLLPVHFLPSPVNPYLQVQLWPPLVLLQTALTSHLCELVLHSSISKEKKKTSVELSVRSLLFLPFLHLLTLK